MRLNSDKKKITVWFAKVPQYLGKRIMALKSGELIGTLLITPSSQNMQCNIKLSDKILSTGIPKEHSVEIKDRNTNMYLVKDLKSAMSIEGMVQKECFINPVLNAEYLRYKKAQKQQESVAEEKVKMIDYFIDVKRTAKFSTLREMDMLARKRKQELQDKRRERLDKEDILEIIFNCFERHPLWTVRDLADFSGQPVAYIQELVNEICTLNKSDHKNTYELKPEFRQQHG